MDFSIVVPENLYFSSMVQDSAEDFRSLHTLFYYVKIWRGRSQDAT